MVKVIVKCICGEVFQPEIDLSRYAAELDRKGIVPLLVPHGDHFVTVYVDKKGSVRGVERVILVDEDTAPVLASDNVDYETIREITLNTERQADPTKDYNKFVSLILTKINAPEELFLAGEIIGYHLWIKWRDPILRMGAKYVPQLDLIIKSELKPILDRTGDTELTGNNEIRIENTSAPQFVVGLAQGVLNGVSNASKGTVKIKIEYEIIGDAVQLSVLS